MTHSLIEQAGGQMMPAAWTAAEDRAELDRSLLGAVDVALEVR